MTTAEKLAKVAENEAVIKDAAEQLDLCLKGNKVDGKSWYDEFWDSFKGVWEMQYLFGGQAWNDTTFYPKYDLIVSGAYNVACMFVLNQVTNLKARLLECGVKLDLSKCINFYSGFQYAVTTELPEIDLSNCNTITNSFSNMSKLVSIDKVTFKEGVTFSNTFNNLSKLENIRIGGTISGNGFNVQWSTKLTHDSLKSIIQALSTTTTGLTITLPTTAQANYEAVYGTGSWAVLTATRSNWTIAYA